MMKKNKKSLLFILSGLLCIAAALILFVHNTAESRHAQSVSRRIADDISSQLEEAYEGGSADFPIDNPERKMPALTVDGSQYAGILSIPSLKLELPVAADFDYDTLQSVPCLYSGNAYGGNMVIGAHNYDAHFGRIASLAPGDEIFFTDAENHRYFYEAYSIETLAPEQVDELVRSEGDGRELTLFTCNYYGTVRIAVRCEGEGF